MTTAASGRAHAAIVRTCECVFKCWFLLCLCGLWSDCFHVSKFTQVIMASQDKTGQLLCIVQFTTKFFKKELDSLQDFYLSLFFWGYSSFSFIFGLDAMRRNREPREWCEEWVSSAFNGFLTVSTAESSCAACHAPQIHLKMDAMWRIAAHLSHHLLSLELWSMHGAPGSAWGVYM